MRLLLDTHILVWFVEDASLLLPREIRLLNTADTVAVSSISLWELNIKWQLRHASGDRKGPIDPKAALYLARRIHLPIVKLTPDHAVAALDPQLDHKDPFDQLLLTQAQQGGYRLLTRDEKLAAHPVALVA